MNLVQIVPKDSLEITDMLAGAVGTFALFGTIASKTAQVMPYSTLGQRFFTPQTLSKSLEFAKYPLLRSLAPLAVMSMSYNAARSFQKIVTLNSHDIFGDMMCIGGAALGIASIGAGVNPELRAAVAFTGICFDLIDLGRLIESRREGEITTYNLVVQTGLTLFLGVDVRDGKMSHQLQSNLAQLGSTSLERVFHLPHFLGMLGGRRDQDLAFDSITSLLQHLKQNEKKYQHRPAVLVCNNGVAEKLKDRRGRGDVLYLRAPLLSWNETISGAVPKGVLEQIYIHSFFAFQPQAASIQCLTRMLKTKGELYVAYPPSTEGGQSSARGDIVHMADLPDMEAMESFQVTNSRSQTVVVRYLKRVIGERYFLVDLLQGSGWNLFGHLGDVEFMERFYPHFRMPNFEHPVVERKDRLDSLIKNINWLVPQQDDLDLVFDQMTGSVGEVFNGDTPIIVSQHSFELGNDFLLHVAEGFGESRNGTDLYLLSRKNMGEFYHVGMLYHPDENHLIVTTMNPGRESLSELTRFEQAYGIPAGNFLMGLVLETSRKSGHRGLAGVRFADTMEDNVIGEHENRFRQAGLRFRGRRVYSRDFEAGWDPVSQLFQRRPNSSSIQLIDQASDEMTVWFQDIDWAA